MTEQKQGQTPADRRTTWARFDPEAVLLALLGLGTFFYGTQALLRWALAGWQSGRAVGPLAVTALAVILPVAFLLLIRRRWWALAVGMIWLGAAAYCLVASGFSLPASWFG